MNLGRHPFVKLVVFIALVATVTEGSRLVRASLLKPETWDCFTSRAEDRPFAYPLIAQLVKIKDMAVRGFKTIMDFAKDYKLE